MARTLIPYLILFVLVVAARLLKDRFMLKNNPDGTQVGAVVNSPAEPVVIYANPVDQFLAENYPNANR